MYNFENNARKVPCVRKAKFEQECLDFSASLSALILPEYAFLKAHCPPPYDTHLKLLSTADGTQGFPPHRRRRRPQRDPGPGALNTPLTRLTPLEISCLALPSPAGLRSSSAGERGLGFGVWGLGFEV